eukprot:scaffold8828_cov204-Amphora_coffeaeformis.AAC.33
MIGNRMLCSSNNNNNNNDITMMAPLATRHLDKASTDQEDGWTTVVSKPKHKGTPQNNISHHRHNIPDNPRQQQMRDLHAHFLRKIRSAQSARKALYALKEMKTFYIKPHTEHFQAALGVCAQRQEWEKAVALLDEMQQQPYNIQPDVVMYNTVLNACTQAGEWEKVFALWEEMEMTIILKPTVATYAIVLVACHKSHQWEFCERVQKYMMQRSIQPDSAMYNIVLQACVTGGYWHRALLLFDEMKQNGLPTDIVTYHALIQTSANAGKWKLALGLLYQVQQHPNIQPDWLMYNTAIRACCQAGQWERARLVLGDMKQSGIIPDVVTHSETFREACEKSQRWELLKSKPEAHVAISPRQLSYNLALAAVDCYKPGTYNYNPLSSWIGTGKNQIVCDLHGMSLATACMLVSDILLAWTRQWRINQHRDIYIITGRGVHSALETGPVLRFQVQNFLHNNSGPKTHGDMGNNGGFFLIKKGSILKWIRTKKFIQFKQLVFLRQSLLLAGPNRTCSSIEM